MEKNKRIEELLLTPRMFYADYNDRVNQLKGLKMLIDEYINENTVMVEIGSFSGISSELFSLYDVFSFLFLTISVIQSMSSNTIILFSNFTLPVLLRCEYV